MLITDTETIEVVRLQCNNCGEESGTWEVKGEGRRLMAYMGTEGWIVFNNGDAYCPECKKNHPEQCTMNES